jgi:hypothetical protein
MKTDRQQEHQWLQKLAGEWTCEGEAVKQPGRPLEKWKATESVRSLGGVWFLCEGRGEMADGGPSTTQMMLGYDDQTQRYVGTFAASTMSHLWVYDGALDADGRVLTLDTEGPDFSSEGKMTRYKDVLEFQGDDRRRLTSYLLGADGEWAQLMSAQYQRTGRSNSH